MGPGRTRAGRVYYEFEMPADDDGSRKKRGAENQLTQHNWDNEGDEETPATVRGGRHYCCFQANVV